MIFYAIQLDSGLYLKTGGWSHLETTLEKSTHYKTEKKARWFINQLKSYNEYGGNLMWDAIKCCHYKYNGNYRLIKFELKIKEMEEI